MEHSRGGSRAVLTQTSAAPGGRIYLLPSIQPCPTLSPFSDLFKPLCLSSSEDQSTHWAGQQLPSGSSIIFTHLGFLMQCRIRWAGEDTSRQHPRLNLHLQPWPRAPAVRSAVKEETRILSMTFLNFQKIQHIFSCSSVCLYRVGCLVLQVHNSQLSLVQEENKMYDQSFSFRTTIKSQTNKRKYGIFP